MISRGYQAGVTLIELLISVVILGIIMAIVGPIFSSTLTFMEATKKSEVLQNNQKLASGMLSYARNNGGILPPERGGKYELYDATAAVGSAGYDLYLELTGAGVPPNQINSAGYGIDAAKLYQVVSNLKHKQPLFFSSGDEVTLTYQVGVIYQSVCPRLHSCASSPFSNYNGVARTPKITEATIVSWDVAGNDYAPVMINTLAEQKTMLRVTIGRLNRLTDRISSHFYAKARASESAGENHFAGTAALAGAANHGCWTAWESLSTTATLESIGLDRREYGKTAWGGDIEYCRDYKPTGTGGQPPFFAALRFNKDLRPGMNPDPSNANSNVIVTF